MLEHEPTNLLLFQYQIALTLFFYVTQKIKLAIALLVFAADPWYTRCRWHSSGYTTRLLLVSSRGPWPTNGALLSSLSASGHGKGAKTCLCDCQVLLTQALMFSGLLMSQYALYLAVSCSVKLIGVLRASALPSSHTQT